jgi:hypothetical protein
MKGVEKSYDNRHEYADEVFAGIPIALEFGSGKVLQILTRTRCVRAYILARHAQVMNQHAYHYLSKQHRLISANHRGALLDVHVGGS